jgi:hypothetical protein
MAKIDEVMTAAETLWVDGLAADRLAAVVNGDRTAVLRTDVQWSACHHVARAYAGQNPGPKPWRSFVIEHEEPFLDVVVERAKAKLMELTRRPQERINERLDKETIIAFVASVPDAAVAAKLHASWPKLVVVFLWRPAASISATALPSIEPSPTKTQEDRAKEDNDDAWDHMNS